MSPAERLRLLGPKVVAEIHHRVAQAPPPPPEIVEELRRMFAPQVAQLLTQRAAEAQDQPQFAKRPTAA